MLRRILLWSFIGFSLVITTACGGEGAKKEADYDATKKMVVDILQTEDGKKALREIMTDEEMKKQLVIESDIVKKSINETLASEKGVDTWKKLFEDPKFVEGFAKSMEKEQKDLMKDLMDDPEYQKKMLDLLKNPEVTEQVMQLLKSQQFRSHLQESIQETLNNPIFQAQIQDILLKAAEKQGQEGKKQEGKKQDQQGGGSGGEGEGGGGG